ncbi:hypothetical protein FOA52_010976 [Chlamydomonas sp. UWO 241]|nr:hypothetical protein FOA52_010976 [Chlamydomonas sp. UWO 241]
MGDPPCHSFARAGVCVNSTARRVCNLAAPAPVPRRSAQPARQQRTALVSAGGQNPMRAAITGLVSGIYKATGGMAAVDPSTSPLWTAIMKLDLGGVKAAISTGGNLNETNANGDTPLLYIARQGHYKYPPADIPRALCVGGANKEAVDKQGMTALQVSLIAGWQNISYELINQGASTASVPAIKGRLTCPDCKRLVAEYNL